MPRSRRFWTLALLGALLLPALPALVAPAAAQVALGGVGPLATVPRPVRRDLPLPPEIRRAYAAGTRDPVTGAPGAAYWQQRVDYAITASLDTATAVVRGTETVTLHNTTPDTLRHVVLRLYQNYFRPTEQRDDYVTDVTDGLVLEQLAVDGAPIALGDSARYAVTGTVATATPAAAIAPGATATITATWHFTVPRVDTTQRGERMGRYGRSLFQVAQWYPQVAMFDDMRGWDTDQYLGVGEFYNQFGSFDVRLTVPAGWPVGATGDLQNAAEVLSPRTRERLALALRTDTTVHVITAAERRSGVTMPGTSGMLTWHFTAPYVNDFAWATSRDYIEDATHATIPGKGVIPVTVLYLPQHTDYATLNTAQIGRYALEHHSRYLFPYEFSQGTIADGPETGMEYPMIIFDGPEFGVTVHEFGHEWFPMMVGSNETRYGWQDEGFNEFIDAAAAADHEHRANVHAPRAASYRRIAGTVMEAPMMWPTDWVGPYATVTTYAKAPVALNALGGVVGDSAVHLAVARYAQTWKFRHPSPWDFFASMNHALGRNLDWFWYQWWFTTHTFDQGIAAVTVANGHATVTVRDRAEMAMPILLRAQFTDGTTTEVTEPVDVWFGGARTATVTIPLAGKTLRSVTVDPDNRFQDLDRSDNVWTAP